MTVDVYAPFMTDFLGDKSFGLDDLDFSPHELDQMASAFGSNLAPALVPSMDSMWTFPPQQQPLSATGGSSATTADGQFVNLEQLHHAGSPTSAQSMQPVAAASPASSGSPQQSGSTSNYSPSGDGTSDDYEPSGEVAKPAKKDPRIGKRKPDVDLSTITDIAERRKQRRLAKNRATAASSRERKRKQLTELSVRVGKLEQENAALTRLVAQRDTEVANLKSALDATSKGLHPSLIAPMPL